MILWSVGSELKSETNNSNRINDFEVLPGNYLIGAGEDSKIYIWNFRNKTSASILSTHTGSVLSVLLINESYFASSSKDRSIIIWRIRDFGVEKKLKTLTRVI